LLRQILLRRMLALDVMDLVHAADPTLPLSCLMGLREQLLTTLRGSVLATLRSDGYRRTHAMRMYAWPL
jgi:hypothetical protein